MNIYTSYWAMVRKFPKNLVGLNTTIFSPRWRPMGKDKRGVICVDCPPFKPGRECEGLCCGKCDPKHPQDCAFLKTYKAQLDRLNLTSIQNSLGKLATQISKDEHLNDIDFAFLVYETPTNECSERGPIQQWFKENGIDVKEWQPNI